VELGHRAQVDLEVELVAAAAPGGVQAGVGAGSPST
jgi:hypothetical protein